MDPMLCSPDRPWGIHPRVMSDAACARCGWVAPGPVGDAALDADLEAREREWLRARAAEFGLIVLDPVPQARLAA